MTTSLGAVLGGAVVLFAEWMKLRQAARQEAVTWERSREQVRRDEQRQWLLSLQDTGLKLGGVAAALVDAQNERRKELGSPYDVAAPQEAISDLIAAHNSFSVLRSRIWDEEVRVLAASQAASAANVLDAERYSDALALLKRMKADFDSMCERIGAVLRTI